jgi:hypothetical protein
MTIKSYVISSYQNKFKFEFYFELDGNALLKKMCTLKTFYFFNIIVTNDENGKTKINIFTSICIPFYFLLNLNSIQFNLNSIEFGLKLIKFNPNCLQCH